MVEGDLHAEYQRDFSHVCCRKVTYQLPLQHLQHCFVASSEHQVVVVDGEDGLRLSARARCAVVDGVVVRVVDVYAGFRRERLESNLHKGVDGAVPFLGALTKTVQAFAKSPYQRNSGLLTLLLVARGHFESHFLFDISV